MMPNLPSIDDVEATLQRLVKTDPECAVHPATVRANMRRTWNSCAEGFKPDDVEAWVRLAAHDVYRNP